MSMELELKYLLAAPQHKSLPPLLTQYGKLTDNKPAALLNAYFDTADNWFRRHDMGLRTRQKNGRFEQTIKLAGQQHGALQARPEYNVAAAGIIPDLAAFPSYIWPAATDISALQQQLTEIFRTDFIRHSWQLTVAGAVLDIVYDNGEVVAGSDSEAISELELELLEGEAAALFMVAEQLISQLPLRTGWLSKAARGYLLANIQQLPEPSSAPEGLIAILNALQCTEALYYRAAASSAGSGSRVALLNMASNYLQALSTELAALQQATPEMARLSRQAAVLADELKQGVVVFAQPPYNQLLLILARLLFRQSAAEQRLARRENA